MTILKLVIRESIHSINKWENILKNCHCLQILKIEMEFDTFSRALQALGKNELKIWLLKNDEKVPSVR